MSYLVTIDGLSGSGKSTALKTVATKLRSQGLKVHVFHDRLGDPSAAELDEVQHRLYLSPLARLYFMLAVRRQVIDAAIIPSMADDDVTITDRYFTSTIAYQAYGQGLNLDMVSNLSLQAAEGVIPQLVFIVDVPASVALTRMAKRGTSLQVFDEEKKAFHERVRHGYLAQARINKTYVVIDGTQTREKVAKQITTRILNAVRS